MYLRRFHCYFDVLFCRFDGHLMIGIPAHDSRRPKYDDKTVRQLNEDVGSVDGIPCEGCHYSSDVKVFSNAVAFVCLLPTHIIT